MVNAGRVVCITAPFLLSLAALVCLVLVFLAGTIEKNATVDDLYFLKMDLSNFTTATSADLLDSSYINNSTLLSGALDAAKQALGLQDYYTIYLRNECGWNGNDQYSNCSHPESYFWFNPVKVWGLDRTGVDVNDVLPTSVKDGLATYHAASKAVFFLYAAALAAVCVTLLVGFTAIFSRWGSLFTTFFAAAAGLLFAGASGVATALFSILCATLNKELKTNYGITSTVGTKMLSVTWIGTAFALGASFFWLLSVCCCSGRSPYNSGRAEMRGTRAEKTPYTYERVGSPYLGPRDHQSVPLNTFQPQPQHGPNHGAYEPFRPQHV